MTRYEAQDIAFKTMMPQRAKIVFLAISSFSDKGNTCFPSMGTIAQRAGISQRSVQRAIADLIALGLVSKLLRSRRDGGDTSNLYTLTPLSVQTDTPPGDKLTPHEAEYSRMGVTDRPAREDNAMERTPIGGNGLPNKEKNVQSRTSTHKPSRDIPLEDILRNCELERMPADCQIIFRDAVTRLYHAEQLRIGKSLRLPQPVIRENLRYLDRRRIENAWQKFVHIRKRTVRPIQNSSAYVTVLLYNSISEAVSGPYLAPVGVQALKSVSEKLAYPYFKPIQAPGPAEYAAMERMMEWRKKRLNAIST